MLVTRPKICFPYKVRLEKSKGVLRDKCHTKQGAITARGR
jgi:hypothetical protein